MSISHWKLALVAVAALTSMPALGQLATKTGGDAVKGGSSGSASANATKQSGTSDAPAKKRPADTPVPVATKRTAAAPATTRKGAGAANAAASPSAVSHRAGAAPVAPGGALAGITGPADLLAKCRAGNAVGCWELGGVWIRGEGVPQDFAKGSVAMIRACDLGVGQGCFVVGAIADNAHDTPKAVALFRRACDGGIGEACDAVGAKLRYGRGVATDRAGAVTMFDHGCAFRWGESCAALAGAYGDGEDLVDGKNARLAMFYADKGCEAGNGYSCAVAGALTLGLNGGAADRTQAERYNKLGCNFDNADACMNLGYVFSQRDEWQSTRDVYAKACKLKADDACSKLGEIDKYLSDVATAGAARARWDAKQAEQRDQVDRLLRSGDVNDAMRVAAYDMGSIEQVSRIVVLANDAGRLGEIDDIFFEAFETWQLTPDAKRLSSQENRKRVIAARQAARAQYYNAPSISYSSNSWSSTPNPAWSTPTPSLYINSSQICKDASENVSRSYCAAGWSHC